MKSRKDEVRRYWGAAVQRLEVAQHLVDHTTYYHDAMYLAGYAVECALKALILARTPKSSRDARLEELSKVGSKGHDLEYLKEQLERATAAKRPPRSKPSVMPREIKEDLRRVREWTTEWRYESGIRKERDAQAFLAAVTRICEWVKRSK
jgi:HEPN domain-containing protein